MNEETIRKARASYTLRKSDIWEEAWSVFETAQVKRLRECSPQDYETINDAKYLLAAGQEVRRVIERYIDDGKVLEAEARRHGMSVLGELFRRP